jgi:hypothetical protein
MGMGGSNWGDDRSVISQLSDRNDQADTLLRRFLVHEADVAVIVWGDRAPDVRRVPALVERKGMPVRVIGGPEKKPKVKRREPELQRREGLLPD